jgi:hypothetical protein
MNRVADDNSFLGNPVADFQHVASGCRREFDGGNIYWALPTGAHEVHGAILDRYLAHGGPEGSLGFPRTNETIALDTVGRFNIFEDGALYYFPWGNAYMLRGEILAKWNIMGRANSVLGYPISDEMVTADGLGVFNRFQYGIIVAGATHGAVFLKGNLLRQWDESGAVLGPWGYPISDHHCDGFRCTQAFEGGVMTTDPDTVDMRSIINAKGIAISDQRPRGTCSVMAMTFLQEYGYTDLCGWNTPWADLSEEFLNHAANMAYEGIPGGDGNKDGGYFHQMAKGYNDFGVIWETTWPYRNVDDYDYDSVVLDPSWIPFGQSTVIPGLRQRGKFIQPNEPEKGMTDDELAETFMNIRHGVPVALGRGHSQVAVGYFMDPSAPGGGMFIMRNSYGLEYAGDDTPGYQYFDFENIQNGISDAFAYVRKMDTQVTWGPVSINLMAFDSIVHGAERVTINDRARLFAKDNSWATVTAGRAQSNTAELTVGNDVRVGDITSRGGVILKRAIVDGDVLCDRYVSQDDPTVSGDIITAPVDPFAMLRTDESYFDDMFQNVSTLFVESGQTRIIYPAIEYGDIYVRDGGNLMLSGSGAFYVRKLHVDAGGHIDMAASRSGQQVALYSPSDFSFGPGARISGSARYMLWVTLGDNVYIGPGCFFHGTVAAPNAHISIDSGASTQIYGAFHGRSVVVQPDSELIHSPFWY